jgi:hypothetical protein
MGSRYTSTSDVVTHLQYDAGKSRIFEIMKPFVGVCRGNVRIAPAYALFGASSGFNRNLSVGQTFFKNIFFI